MKQTKKIVVFLLSLCIMLSCVFAFASCQTNSDCLHSETEWVVTKEATATEDGSKNEICKACQKVLKTESIPATGEPDVPPTPDTPKPIPTPAGLALNGTVVSWNAVEGATGYVVKVGENTYPVTETSLDVATLSLAAGDYAVAVQTVIDDKSSDFCEAITVTYTPGQLVLAYAANTVSWNEIIGATDFEVRVNGGDPVAVKNERSLKITLTKSGDNLIEVRCTNLPNSEWIKLSVTAYTVTYDSRSLAGGEVVEYLATGDTMTLPTADFTTTGYEFTGWYTATENGDKYENGAIFAGTADLMVYGGWNARKYALNLNVDGLGITNIKNGTTFDVTYDSDYTLPVPEFDNEDNVFLGWFSAQSTTSTKYADETGKSVGVAKFTENTNIYPVFVTGVFAYELQDDDTYAITAGPNFNKLTKVTIPVTHGGKTITTILENAFESRKQLVSINIPNTIQLVGSGAFVGNSSLKEINVYEVEGKHEVRYYSYDGALVRNDMGTMTLEVFPRAKTGTFKTPEGVTTIRNKVFQYSNISKVIISKDVVSIYERAFYSCKALTEVEFEGGRDSEITLMCGTSSDPDSIFYGTSNVRSIHFPAKLATFNYTYVLNQLTQLTNISVEDGGVNYSAVDGMLTNGEEDSILYAPISLSGAFTVPDGIISIGPSAFENRTGITSVTIPMFVESIGNKAFYGCTSVTNVDIKGNRFFALSIGTSAFAACNALTDVTIGGNGSDTKVDAGVITIGASAFAPASSATALLENVVFDKGANVASVGANAFNGQKNLTTLTFASNVQLSTIESSAFTGTAIKTLKIPASVTAIGASAFKNCNELTSVTFTEGSSGNITFGDSAFANCAKITSVFLPSTVTAFNGTVFNGCAALTKIEVDAQNPTLESDKNGILYDESYSTIIYYPRGLAVDKATIDTLPWDKITTIGSAAFSGHTTLTSFEIKKGVTTIGAEAFSGCTALATVTYEVGAPAGATLTVGKNAFLNCKALTSATLPEYTISIGEAAFKSTAFANFTIPESVVSIGADAFASNAALTAINIPAKVTTIGAGAFQSCTALASVNIDGSADASLFTFQDSGTKGAFLGCGQLTSIDLKNRAKNIGAYCFKGTGISEITLGTNVTTIGKFAFNNTHIASIFIPKNVTSIGEGAFAADNANTAYLTSVNFEEGTASLSIDTGAFKNAKISTITFPARITKLDADVTAGSLTSYIKVSNIADLFAGCTLLETINVTPGENNKYVSIDGVLYKATNGVPVTLLYCPALNPGKLVDNVATLVIPKTVTLVENRSLLDLAYIKTIDFENYTAGSTNYNKQLLFIGRGGIEAYVQGNKYAVIGGNKNEVTTINLPAHLAMFGTYAISTTKNQVTLNVNPAASNLMIAKYAFNGAKIVKYNFPGVKELGQNAFSGAFSSQFTSTEKENLPFEINLGAKSTLTALPAHAFNSVLVDTFVVPASVKQIGQSFYNASRLQTVSFEKGSQLESIGGSAFGLCKSLTAVDFTNATKITSLGGNVFQNCTSLLSFTFPETVVAVGAHFFSGCSKLQSITLNKNFTEEMLYTLDNSNHMSSVFGSLVTMNYDTERYEADIANVYVDPANPHFVSDNGILYNKDKTIIYYYPTAKSAEGYDIPNTVTQIGHFAFQAYKGTTLTIPDGVTFIGDNAFQYSNIKDITIGSNVESLGYYAFHNCLDLETVNFKPNNKMTSIGDGAFTGDNNLVEVNNIPDTVSYIGVAAFNNCVALNSVILPSGLTKIEKQLFQNCYGLSELVIQDNISEIGDMAFLNCGLAEVVIPSSVVSIGNKAFQTSNNNKSSLVSVTFRENSKLGSLGSEAFEAAARLEYINLPATLREVKTVTSVTPGSSTTYVNSDTFLGCSSLKSISIPGLTSIPANMFEGCTSLESIELGSELVSIGQKAFYGNESLKNITIPASVIEIGLSAFENCYALETLEFEQGSLVTVLGMSATTEDNIFKNTTSLKSVTLPEGITYIGGHVFENSGVSSVNFDKLQSLKTIGNSAFANCDNLTKVVVLTNVTYVGDYAFYNCDNLATASLTFGVEYLGALAFGACNKLTDAYIPSSVYNISGNPYAGCAGITGVRIDADNSYLQLDSHGSVYNTDMTVLYCYSPTAPTENVVIPSTVKNVAAGAFAGTAIKSITFPKSAGAIKPYTFYDCDSLESVTIENGVTGIGDYAFYGCDKLNNVTIPATATTLGNYTFANCAQLSNVSFGSVTATYTIGTHFFENCVSMTEVILPAKLLITDADALAIGNAKFYTLKNGQITTRKTPMNHTIPSYMFAGTGIVNAVIPAHITQLDSIGVFMNCQSLTDITFEAPALTYSFIGAYMFYNCDSLVEIEIPNGKTDTPLFNKKGYTFAECDNLESVTLYYQQPMGIMISQPPREKGMFMNAKKLKNFVIYNVSSPITDDDGGDDGGGSGGGGGIIFPGFGPSIGGNSIGNISDIVTKTPSSFGGISTLGLDIGGSIGGGGIIGPGTGGGTEPTVPEEGVEYNQVYLDYIGDYFFMGCEELEEITIKNNSHIGDSAFEGCASLKKVNFYDPKAISDEDAGDDDDDGGSGGGGGIIGPGFGPSIGGNSFSGGISLAGISIGPSIGGGGIVIGPSNPGDNEGDGEEDAEKKVIVKLSYLGDYAFKGCTALTSITMPGIPGRSSVGIGVFEGWGANQTINLCNTEAELADQIAGGLFEGCNATIVYAE